MSSPLPVSAIGLSSPPAAIPPSPSAGAEGDVDRNRSRALLLGSARAVRAAGRGPSTFEQEHFWLLERWHGGNPVYNVPFAFRLRGTLRPVLWLRALAALQRHHEAMRTVLCESEAGQLEQRVRAPEHPALPVIDLAGLAAAEVEAEEARVLVAVSRRSFDLARGPIARYAWVRRHRAEAVLLYTAHHAIVDDWCRGLFVSALRRLLPELAAGRRPKLPAVPIQGLAYARWQRSWPAPEVLEAQRTYWRRRLEDLTTVLELPADRPLAPGWRDRGAEVAIPLSSALEAKLREVARRTGTSLYGIGLAATGALLGRLTGTDDLGVGTPVTRRTMPELREAMGCFLNTILLRFDLRDDPPFSRLAARVQATLTEALAHRELPFHEVVRSADGLRTGDGEAPIQVLFTRRGLRSLAGDVAPGVTLEPVRVVMGIARADWSVSLDVVAGGLRLSLEYRTGRFDRTTALRVVRRMAALLEAAADDPERRLGELPVLSRSELQALVVEPRSEGAARGPTPVVAAIAQWVQRTPGAPAVAGPQGEISYAALWAESGALAGRLAALGVGPEVRVGLVADRSAAAIVGMLAVLRAGGAYLPIDPAYPERRIRFMVEDGIARQAGPALLLVEPAALPEAFEVPDGVTRIPIAEPGGSLSAEPAPEYAPVDGPPWPEQAAYVIFTSGSTGRPKGVVIAHGPLSGMLAWSRRALGLAPGERWAWLAGPGFDASVWIVWSSLTAGATVTLPDFDLRSAAERILDWVGRSGTTIAHLPTPLVEQAAVSPPEGWRRLRLLLNGGDRLHRLPPGPRPFALLNCYGPTEVTVVSTADRVVPEPDRDPPIGRPIDGIRGQVADARGRLQPLGTAGELLLGGRAARGYLGRPGPTAERFVPDPWCGEPGRRLYRSGDRVRLLADGRIEFLGRIDQQVKIRGLRIELGEVEASLRELPEIRDAVVTVHRGGGWDERLVAYVVPRAGADAGEGRLRDELRRRLPGFMVPARFVPLEALPLNQNGKLDRRALPPPDLTTAAGETAAAVAPADEVEEILAGIWSEVLGIGRVGRHGDFVALGGHSLLVMQALSRIRQSLGVELGPEELFSAPTPERLARRLASVAGAAGPPIQPGSATEVEGPLTTEQEQFWLLEQWHRGSAAYTVPAVLRVEGTVPPSAWQRSLAALCARHEALRTVFPEPVPGEPVQRVLPAVVPALPVVDLTRLEARRRRREGLRIAALEACRPFDLARGPLVRFTWIGDCRGEGLLLLTGHHIVLDEWSRRVLLGELLRLPGVPAGTVAPRLEPLPIRLLDYARWQSSWPPADSLDAQRQYWRRTLEGLDLELALPFDRPEPEGWGDRGAEVAVELEPEVEADLEALARRSGATFFMVGAAAWALVLGRLCGREDVAFGSPVSRRVRRELEELVGCFLNTELLRVDLAGDPSFETLVQRVRRACLGALANLDLPFHRMVEMVGLRRLGTPGPPVPVLFVSQDLRGAARGPAGGPRVELVPVSTRSARAQWSLQLDRTASGLRAALEFRTARFDSTTAQRAAAAVADLLRQVVADPARRASELSLLSRAQRHAVLVEARGPCGPPELPVVEGVAAVVRERPDSVALDGAGGAVTYACLWRRSGALARRLVALGVEREARVGLLAGRSAEAVIGMLAVLRAGGAFLPIDPAYPPDRIAFVLRDAVAPPPGEDGRRRAGVLLVGPGGAPEGFTAPPGVIALPLDRGLLDLSDGAGPPVRSALSGQAAYVIYTSGSTGRPKGVVVDHRSLAALLAWSRGRYPAGAGERWPWLMGPAFDVSVWNVWAVITAGGTLLLPELDLRSSWSETFDWVARSSITRLEMPVPMVEEAASSPPRGWEGVRTLFAAGDRLHRLPAVARAFEVVNLYGPTEATVLTTVETVRREPDRDPPIGRALDGQRVHVVDGRGRPVPCGVTGELWIGRRLARGYLRRPGLTAARFVPDPWGSEPGERLYRTGDLGRLLADGRIEFLGRTDHQVKIRGLRIELGEIESVLLEHPEVREAVVTVLDVERWDQRLVAYTVAAAADGDETAPSRLRAHLEARLPQFMVPSHFISLSALPLTPNGKVDRRALPLPKVPTRAAGAAPTTELERSLARIWEEVLKTAPIRRDDDFFLLGGHSLLATRVIARLNARFGLDLPVRVLFERPSIRALARSLEEALARRGGAPAAAAAISRRRRRLVPRAQRAGRA